MTFWRRSTPAPRTWPRRRRVGDRDRPDGARGRAGRRSRTPGCSSTRPSSSQRPTTRTPVEEDRVGTLMRLIDALEDHDDVQARPRELRRGRRGARAGGRSLRIAAAVFWVFAGAMHFVIPRQYEAIVPPRLARWKKELVVVSGVAEIAGGIAPCCPTRPAAARAGGSSRPCSRSTRPTSTWP